jgi:hypothetical protein
MPNSLVAQHYPDDFFILSYHGTLASDTILFWADRDYVIDQISVTLLTMSSSTGSNGRLSFLVTSDAGDFNPANTICTADCRTVANSGTGAAGTTFVFDSERFPSGVTKQFDSAGVALTSVATLSATGATTAVAFSSTNNILRRGQFLTMAQTTNTGAGGLVQIRLRSRIG